MTNLDSILKSRDITLSTKVRLVKAMVFPVVMYGCESWTVKKAECWRIDAFELWYGEDSWESLGLQGDQPVHPKGDQSWMFIGRTDFEAATPVLWPPDVKSWLIWKDPDAGKDWGQEKGTTEDEMVGWHHRLSGHGFGWTLGVGDGQGGLACCDSQGRKESDTTERLNSTEQQKGVVVGNKYKFMTWHVKDELWPNVLFLKKFFGREKISLQCCVSFCHTTQINHSYMYISLLRLPPSSLMSSWKFIFILNPGLDKMIKSTT